MLRCLSQVYSGAVGRSAVVVATWLSVLLLAVLNPLACVVHCAISTHALGRGTHASPLFLCQLPAADAPAPALAAQGEPMAQAPISGGIQSTPRPFYEMLAATALLMAAIFLTLVAVDLIRTAMPPRRAIFPPIPPPRMLAPAR